jgi:hypothetical protein
MREQPGSTHVLYKAEEGAVDPLLLTLIPTGDNIWVTHFKARFVQKSFSKINLKK